MAPCLKGRLQHKGGNQQLQLHYDGLPRCHLEEWMPQQRRMHCPRCGTCRQSRTDWRALSAEDHPQVLCPHSSASSAAPTYPHRSAWCCGNAAAWLTVPASTAWQDTWPHDCRRGASRSCAAPGLPKAATPWLWKKSLQSCSRMRSWKSASVCGSCARIQSCGSVHDATDCALRPLGQMVVLRP